MVRKTMVFGDFGRLPVAVEVRCAGCGKVRAHGLALPPDADGVLAVTAEGTLFGQMLPLGYMDTYLPAGFDGACAILRCIKPRCDRFAQGPGAHRPPADPVADGYRGRVGLEAQVLRPAFTQFCATGATQQLRWAAGKPGTVVLPGVSPIADQ